ncbi:peroxisomal N(1)-acetyl-spermine/spermidine oxidase [Drosophila persimilis]|uniref:peroxisomal N(1)-acetyl-spermine/spermidine oxidase n=1 Tax=Drosophila persimilis TaxID=7234 RepID=UPI000F097999|nr:peroxisomal N(1)-acetyl-spermine/spermidine oxidase [Drosophila persimilis]
MSAASLRLLSKTKQTARIIIVGAGSAGIAAATRLLEQGFRNVLLLEAEDRIGGRIHTIPFADNVVDLGAQWCHGEQGNVVYQRVKDQNMLEATEPHYDNFKCVRSNGEVLPEAIAEPLKTIAFNSIPERQTDLGSYDGSLGDYLDMKYWKELAKLPPIDRTIAEEFLEVFHKFEASVEAADHLYEVSGRGHLEYWLCEGELLLNWRQKGYKQFLRVLMKAQDAQPEDLGVLKGHVLLNKRIAEINWEGADELKIRCWNGEIHTADHVICTVSLGVLKEQHRHLFVPNLPAAKVRAIDGLKLGTVDKFFLEFTAPPLPEDWPGFNCLWLKKDLDELRGSELFWLESVFGFYPVSHQPRILQGWIIGAHARHMETLTEETVLQGLLWLFRKFLPFEVAPPQRFLRTQWHANPNFRGSYTFRSTYTDELRTGAWDLEAPLTDVGGRPRLQFAGESSHKHYYSTVHGAVETGWREAERLNVYYKARTAQL